MMDWGHTNNNPLTTWSERTPLDWPSYKYGRPLPDRGMEGDHAGAPHEVMIDLCNAANTDCWINIPAMVDEDYIRQVKNLGDAVEQSIMQNYAIDIYQVPPSTSHAFLAAQQLRVTAT